MFKLWGGGAVVGSKYIVLQWNIACCVLAGGAAYKSVENKKLTSTQISLSACLLELYILIPFKLCNLAKEGY